MSHGSEQMCVKMPFKNPTGKSEMLKNFPYLILRNFPYLIFRNHFFLQTDTSIHSLGAVCTQKDKAGKLYPVA